jgi:Galactokinase galactose-binding signature
VNLIDDHTDHDDGFVLPLAIAKHVVAAIARWDDGRARFPASALSLPRAPSAGGTPESARQQPGRMATPRPRAFLGAVLIWPKGFGAE